MKAEISQQARKIAQQIENQYNELNNETPYFFDQHHDDMRIQRDCSYEELTEIEAYEQRGEIKFAKIGLKNLKETLIYMKAIIKLQEQTNNLPRSIYG